MKIIKIITVALVLFAALSFGYNTTAPVEKTTTNTEIKIAPHKLHGPIGMSDEEQF